jgi:hypothetical protein
MSLPSPRRRRRRRLSHARRRARSPGRSIRKVSWTDERTSFVYKTRVWHRVGKRLATVFADVQRRHGPPSSCAPADRFVWLADVVLALHDVDENDSECASCAADNCSLSRSGDVTRLASDQNQTFSMYYSLVITAQQEQQVWCVCCGCRSCVANCEFLRTSSHRPHMHARMIRGATNIA